jgi:hypothetical protein
MTRADYLWEAATLSSVVWLPILVYLFCRATA